MTKKLIACGCSFTIDNYQNTWPNFLSEELNVELINIAARGAGLDFISKRLITYISKNKQADISVAVMLPSADRFDLYVDEENPQKIDFLNISGWQGGKHPDLINLDGELSNDHGYCLTGGHHRGPKKYWYKHFYSETFAYINYWFNVLSIQNYLQLIDIPYFFIPAYDLDDLTENIDNKKTAVYYKEVLDLIDFDRFIFYKNNSGFLRFVKDNNFPVINNHPTAEAHQSFVRNVILPVYTKHAI